MRRLREIMDEVYRLFDRRCKTQTALKKLAKLRRRVRRFKALGQALNKLFSPNLEKALEFLDDRLLGSTSNAVARSNRRFRKAQNSIDSARRWRSSTRRFRICDWIETSSAETGSSAITSLGRAAIARAMPMRWRWPPENSCG